MLTHLAQKRFGALFGLTAANNAGSPSSPADTVSTGASSLYANAGTHSNSGSATDSLTDVPALSASQKKGHDRKVKAKAAEEAVAHPAPASKPTSAPSSETTSLQYPQLLSIALAVMDVNANSSTAPSEATLNVSAVALSARKKRRQNVLNLFRISEDDLETFQRK